MLTQRARLGRNGIAATSDEMPKLLLRREVAELAKCSVRTVARAQALGLLPPAVRNRGGSSRVLYALADVKRWLGLEGVA